MKQVAITTLSCLMIFMSSCMELPDLNPASNENVVVTNVMITEQFDTENNFSIPLDMNGNGTVDFKVMGGVYTDENYGVSHYVIVQGLGEKNTVTRKPIFIDFSCGMQVENYPIQLLTSNFTINGFAIWESVGTFYGHMETPSGCVDQKKHVTYDKDNFFGVKFTDDGEEYYGWVEFRASDISRSGLENSAELWSVKRCAFNSQPGQGLRVPA